MNKCCKNPDVVNMDYNRAISKRGHVEVMTVQNRHCNNCGRHWWDGKEYTRKEWDKLNEVGNE